MNIYIQKYSKGPVLLSAAVADLLQGLMWCVFWLLVAVDWVQLHIENIALNSLCKCHL